VTLFHYYRDPGADGVGVAFTSAELDLADIQERSARAASFARLSDAVGAAVAVVTQVHGNRVLDVTASGAGLLDLTAERADAMITDRLGVALAVRVADCISVLFADHAAGLVGAAHAGRAGVLNGVLGQTIDALQGRGAAAPRAWIGPHICGDCYEVPPPWRPNSPTRRAFHRPPRDGAPPGSTSVPPLGGNWTRPACALRRTRRAPCTTPGCAPTAGARPRRDGWPGSFGAPDTRGRG
jgi:Multi-copper polyphenol oxidoreductase laccase